MKKIHKYSKFFLIALGIVLFFVLVLGTSIWLKTSKKTEKQNLPSETAKQNLPSDWKMYKQDTLGIEFYYPQQWGEPKTEPTQHITDLSHVVDAFTGNTDFNGSLTIDFPQINVSVRVFKNNYQKGRDLQPFDYYSTGLIGDLSDLLRTGKICEYKPSLKDQGHGSLSTTYSACGDGVEEIITTEREDFSNKFTPDVGVVYTYNLNLFAFSKLQNGYFNNVLIKYGVGSVKQVKDSSMTLDQVLTLTDSSNNYKQIKSDFSLFANSVKSYKPIAQEKGTFQNVSGEDPNVTTIRKYYFAITSGDLQSAYDYYREQTVTFDEFKSWYQNTYFANPTQFEKLTNNQYRFYVNFQDNNADPKRYRVTMEVTDGKIKTLSSEEIIGERVDFQGKSAFIRERQGKSQVVLVENNQENVIDEADVPSDGNSFAGLMFNDIKFSPKGDYLTYGATGWEWFFTRIYDIQKHEKILDLSDDSNNGFSADEKYLYGCATSDFDGEQHGNIYALPDLKLQYNVFDDKDNKNYHGLKCDYSAPDNSITFTLSDYRDQGEQNLEKERVIEYSLTEQKASLLK